MFGIKFRTWMESHIVRPRKKQRPKEGGKSGKNAPERVILDSSGNSATNTSAVDKSDEIAPSTLCKSKPSANGFGTTITLSPPSHPGYHQQLVGNNLSSPESAYSTGYSTDGTSPGAGPEYYINIRTGTHYFQHSNGQQGVTVPQPNAGHQHVAEFASHLGSYPQRNSAHGKNLPASIAHQTSGGFSPKHDVRTHDVHGATYKSPQKVAPPPDQPLSGHRRTESCDESRRLVTSPPLATAQLTASPRQRTRIRTNPWLPSNTLSPILGVNPRSSIIDSTTSSSSGFKKGLTESSSSYASSSCDKLSPQVGRDVDRDSICSLTSTCSSRSRVGEGTDDDLTLNEMLGKYDESYVYEKETDILSDSDPTDCDETDMEAGQEGGDEQDTHDEEELDFIDKDSPLDLPCDMDLGNRGHCTYHDFARKPRYRDSVRGRSGLGREEATGSPRPKRHSVRQSEHFPHRRSSRDGSLRAGSRQELSNAASSQSSSKCTSEKKRRQSVHKSARERNLQNKNRLQNSPIFKEKFLKCNDYEVGGKALNFNRMLMQKMLSRENVIGTRSAGNTPISSRKHVKADVTLSPRRAHPARSSAHLHESREKDLDAEITLPYNSKRRSNSVSYSRSTSAATQSDQLTAHASELALIEADKEADRKYRQLILEAEHILISMKGQIPIPLSKHTVPKPNMLLRKFDLEGGLSSSPKMERKELGKMFVDKGHNSIGGTKRSECFSPLLNRIHKDSLVVNKEVRSRELSIIKHRKEDVNCSEESDSEGSVTPKQEDSDELLTNPLKSSEWYQGDNLSNRLKSEVKLSLKRYPEAHLRYQEKDVQNGNIVSRSTSRRNSATNHEQEHTKLSHKSPILLERKPQKPKTTENILHQTANISSIKGDKFLHSRSSENSSPELSKKIPSMMVKSPTLSGVCRPPLVAFRSIDLGSKLDDSNYCPQSEPVKRKVYTCSATFGRLQKSIVEKGQLGAAAQKLEHVEDDSRNSLREKLERLRRERDEKEKNQIVGSTNSDTQQNQRQLLLIRRQMLVVNTIEGLKRSLEDQSAKLKAAYSEGNAIPPKRS